MQLQKSTQTPHNRLTTARVARQDLQFELAEYIAPFRGEVLQHIHEVLPVAEWDRLRSFAGNPRRYIDKHRVADLAATPEEFFDASLTEDGISIAEIQASVKDQDIEYFSAINGQGIGYIKEQGIYFWSKHPEHRLTLMLWLTYPAYPPNW